MRVRNFNAGPGAIPLEVLQKARDEFWILMAMAAQ